ncbi:MAG: type II toxin-antitoxin system VapC family toxin [Candidatus Bathyarchaeota archaeon]|nr:type II toxin-antitoxin system VapC family toxin [Candidatus Bathyarchaeota archaeon]
MSLLLDTSIIVKLVIEEPGSQKARTRVKEVLAQGCTLISVDIALPEALNALWKHTKIHHDLDAEEAVRAAEDLYLLWDRIRIIPSREVSTDALRLAIELGLPIYDSLFLAASRKTRSTLFTADNKLYEASRKIFDSELLSAT